MVKLGKISINNLCLAKKKNSLTGQDTQHNANDNYFVFVNMSLQKNALIPDTVSASNP